MATSRTPLLADDQRSLSTTASHSHNETTLLNGLIATSPTRPFFTTFSPTLLTRTLALLLSIPSFTIFIVSGAHYSAAIVFLSFAIARQLVVLGSHFGSQILVIRIEVVHHRLKAASVRAQEKWIKKSVAAVVDGVILLGLLISLSVFAGLTHGKLVNDGLILGFIVFGLLLLSLPDLGNPDLVTLAISVEKPVQGVFKLAASVLHGVPDDTDENGENTV